MLSIGKLRLHFFDLCAAWPLCIISLARGHILILIQVALEFSDFGGKHLVLNRQSGHLSLCDLALGSLTLARRLFRLFGLFELLGKLTILLFQQSNCLHVLVLHGGHLCMHLCHLLV